MKYRLIGVSALLGVLTVLVAINPFGHNIVDSQMTGTIRIR
jgi:hypothetical protein